MLFSEKIAVIRQELGFSSDDLANVFGLSYRTLRRMEAGHATPKELTAYQIAAAIEGLTPQALLDPAVSLPRPVRLSQAYLSSRLGQPLLQGTSEVSGEVHDGRRLKKFLSQHKIKPAHLANWLSRPRSDINAFYKSRAMRPHVRISIISAMQQQVNPNLTAADIFGTLDLFSAPGSALPPGSGHQRSPSMPAGAYALLPVPFIPAARRQIDADDQLTVPAQNYPVASLLVEAQAKLIGASPVGSICVEVAASDYLEPLAQPGAVLLGFLLTEAQLMRLDEGLLLLRLDDRLTLRRIQANRLSTEGLLDIAIYSPTRPGSQTVTKSRIRAAYKITTVLNSPV